MGGLVAAFSGGKDSTAMVLAMHDRGEDFVCLFTPTGNELPGVREHIDAVLLRIGKKLVLPEAMPLGYWMHKYNALPNWRQRWCTRLIKILPCIEWLKENPGSTLCVGLRADEESRQGLYGDFAEYRYPLREWGFELQDVKDYCAKHDMMPPKRTDCALCYHQKLKEWHSLWKNHPEEFSKGELWEDKTGHTFRSPSRDTWPAALVDLRTAFESGRLPRGVSAQSDMFDDDDEPGACRVCSL